MTQTSTTALELNSIDLTSSGILSLGFSSPILVDTSKLNLNKTEDIFAVSFIGSTNVNYNPQLEILKVN